MSPGLVTWFVLWCVALVVLLVVWAIWRGPRP